MSLDAMKQALEALEEVLHWYQCRDKNDNPMPVRYQNPEIKKSIEAITALRAAIEHAERPQTHSEECWKWRHECAVAKIERLQEGAETLHAMYEQACQQRDQLMDQQRAQVAAMRGRMQ